jgi:hypothetical protein
MLKLMVLLVGIAGGAGAATAWLLSDLSTSGASAAPGDRINEARSRFLAALDEGMQAGQETENRLRGQLNAYRVEPDRPLVKSS